MASRHRDRAYGGAASYPRTNRVNRLLQEVLAEEIERLADADERLRLVTITGVDTSPDLRNATVYLSSLSDDASGALEERRIALQAAVGRQATMKRTPKLSFSIDPGVEQGSKVEELLRRLSEPEVEGP